MISEHLIIDRHPGGILTIGLNRPGKKNAITHAMYRGMEETLKSADLDPEVRVVLIHGSDQVFSAGNDLEDFNNRKPGVSSPGSYYLKTLSTFKKPVIAAVSGLAIGVGATMLLHCDLVYASSDTRFRMPFVNLGLCPEAGSTLLLPARAGYQKAANAFMFGDFFDAKDALSLGLIVQAVPRKDLMAHAMDQAARLACKPENALLQIKRLMKSGFKQQLNAHMELEFDEFNRLLGSRESRELRDKKQKK